jgi:hypothetical protein
VVAGDEGITLKRADAVTVGIPYDGCEVLLRWPDGRRVLIGTDGTTLDVVPSTWVDGAELVSAIDRGVEAERQVDLPEPAEADPIRTVVEPSREWFFVALSAGITLLVAYWVVVDGEGEAAGPVFWAAITAIAVFFLVRARRLRGLRGFPTRWRAQK